VLGYYCAKVKWLDKAAIDGISKLTFNLLIPAFLFEKMATAELAEHIDVNYFLSFYLPLLCVYLLAAGCNYLFHQQYKKQLAPSAVFALGASYSNTVIIGIPVIIAALGEHMLSLVFLIITFHSALLFTLTSLIAVKPIKENQSQSLTQRLAKQTIFNPLVASITLGLLVNVSPLTLPSVLDNTLILLGKPAISLALFLLGASLSYYHINKQKYFISLASIIKLIVLPGCVYIAAQHLFGLPKEATTTLVILSACPTGVNAYLIAKIQNVHRETVAGTIVATTLASLVTIPFWLLVVA